MKQVFRIKVIYKNRLTNAHLHKIKQIKLYTYIGINMCSIVSKTILLIHFEVISCRVFIIYVYLSISVLIYEEYWWWIVSDIPRRRLSS